MIKKKDQLFTSEKAVIASDLFLPLKLYKIPKIFFSQLYKSFPNIKFVELNTPGSPIYNNDASIYFGNIITKETIKKMPGLKWIHFGSVGINRANIKEVYERKIIVTNSKGLLTNSMVTTTLAFISSLFRGIHYCNNLKNENNLSRESFDKYFNNITDLYNKSCLIVGYGDVGKKLAKILKQFDMKIYTISRQKNIDNFVYKNYELYELEEAVSNADIIVNLLPLTKETKNIFSKKIFESMKKNPIFINVGRGETVDEKQLIIALKNKIISGAGLDVFANEPLPKNSLLFDFENVIITPHIAGLNRDYWKKQYELFSHNLYSYFHSKDQLKNLVQLSTESLLDE